jgi:hypothetical protein
VPLIMEISSYFYHLLVAVFIEVLIMDLVSSHEDGEWDRPDLLQSGSSSICDECAAFVVSSMVSDSIRSRWYKLAFLKGWKLP